MPRRQVLSLSTISSWPHTWLIVWLSLREELVRAPRPVLPHLCFLAWTSSWSNFKSLSEETLLIIGIKNAFFFLNYFLSFNFTNLRPRINKLNSVKDSEQKAGGNYFFLEDDWEPSLFMRIDWKRNGSRTTFVNLNLNCIWTFFNNIRRSSNTDWNTWNIDVFTCRPQTLAKVFVIYFSNGAQKTFFQMIN